MRSAPKAWQSLVLLLVFALSNLSLSALGCATCGCSEICPIAMMDTAGGGASGKASILSDSIWGNIILKMAYAKDPELQRLARKLHISDIATTGTIGFIAGGTVAQNIVSMSVLNPPDGIEDSYVPGALGLGLSGATNAAFAARMLVFHRYRKQMKARQIALREQVELVLHHLEFSQTSCPDAQKDLSAIIGDRAAQDCIQLWQSSHLVAALPPKTSSNSSPAPDSDLAKQPEIEIKTSPDLSFAKH